MSAPSITCPRCGAVSFNPHDIAERYCGRCHQFHEFFRVERLLSPADVVAQWHGAVRIAPGIWCDAGGAVHYNVRELLALVGLPDTPEHRARALESCIASARAAGLSGVVVQDEES